MISVKLLNQPKIVHVLRDGPDFKIKRATLKILEKLLGRLPKFSQLHDCKNI